jgi:hypothetical protein
VSKKCEGTYLRRTLPDAEMYEGFGGALESEVVILVRCAGAGSILAGLGGGLRVEPGRLIPSVRRIAV